jgi:hypothetical protein
MWDWLFWTGRRSRRAAERAMAYEAAEREAACQRILELARRMRDQRDAVTAPTA